MFEESAELLWISQQGTTQPRDTFGGNLVDYGMLKVIVVHCGYVLIFVIQDATVLPDCCSRVIENKTQTYASVKSI